MDDLQSFLRQRNVPESTIERMELEKIDASVILIMTDEQLKTYLPSYGDRLAVLGYCRRMDNNPRSRRTKLFDRLKLKLQKVQKDEDPRPSTSQSAVKIKNAQKSIRKVELGWMLFDESKESFIQVRAKKGGGTRKVDAGKDWTKTNLTECAIELFFPGGKSTNGNICDFDIDLTDYQEISMDSENTVGKLYEDTKLPVLRFYLTTKIKKRPETSKTNAGELKRKHEQTQVHTSSESIDVSEVIIIDGNADVNNMDVVTTEDIGNHGEISNVTDNMDDSCIVTFLSDATLFMNEQSLDDTLPLSTENLSSQDVQFGETQKRNIVVHRGQVLQEFIKEFCDESILEAELQVQLVLPDGKEEMGHDEGGVLRDCLSEFWEEFYEQCTMGTSFKVPFLRHDFGKQEWESIGRIIAYGWQKEKYLPVKMAPVILEQATFGKVKSDLLHNFLKYIPVSECMVLESSRADFSGTDMEELLEILQGQGCRKMPTEANFEKILHELAHEKMIQQPAYVIEQWASILSPLRNELQDITVVFDNLQPTGRKIIKALEFPSTLNDQEKNIKQYLTTYIRECDSQRLSRLLRFCTGSDLFLNKTITIDFTNLEGFLRRPVAHTCGCVLELSVHYDNYLDFRCEINKVLESSVWVMDIV